MSTVVSVHSTSRDDRPSSISFPARTVRALLLTATLLLTAVLSAVPLRAQTYLSEDFESGLPSANFTDVGFGVGWQTNSTYTFGGTKAAWFQTAGTSSPTLNNDALTSRAFSLSGSTKPILTFWHIAALERFYDQAIVEVSTDNGVTWVIPSNTQYNGNSWRKTGAYPAGGATTTYVDGPYFDAQSRPEWDIKFTATSSAPTTGQSMWMKEVFDLSAFKSASVKIRFRVKSNSSNDFFGWLIDNISVAEAPPTISGTRLIGTGGYASFRAAAQALADSGVGSGGVTILAAPGTYNDSLIIGYYRGVSASNRVVFKSQNGPSSVFIQRNGNPNFSGQPSVTSGYSNTQFFAAAVLMSGAQYVTFNGITVQQLNWSVANTNYALSVGFFLTGGCRFDSVYQCSAILQNRYYYSVGMMVSSSYYNSAPGIPNVANKLVNDTIVAWNGVMFQSYFPTMAVYDSLNELNATVQGGTFLNLGQPTTASSISSYSTCYNMGGYGQVGLVINNVKSSMGVYGLTGPSTNFTYYGFYGAGGYLINPTISNNIWTNVGYHPTTPNTYMYGFAVYLSGNTVVRAKVLNNMVSDWWDYYGYYKFYVSSTIETLLQGNTVTRMNCYYPSSYYAFYISSNLRPRIIGNKIKDIRFGLYSASSTGTWYGMYLTSNLGGTVVYNNMISDINFNYTSSYSGSAVYGIYYSPGSPAAFSGQLYPSMRDSICNNTIWFGMQSGAASPAYGFTTYCLYVSPSATTGVELYILNNIIGNRTQTTGVAGYYAYGIYRASTSGTVFEDFNDYYVNTTGSGSDPYHCTGYYGNYGYMLSDYKSLTSAYYQNIHSFTELPPFSTTDSLNYINGSTSRLWRAGKALASVTTDYNGASRNIAPTIGASEGSLAVSSTDDVGPAITYARVSKTQSTGAITISATITDPNGVNTSTYPPIIYYKASSSAFWSSATGSNVGGSIFNFTIPGQSYGTKMQFYLAAQDNMAIPNPSTYPNGGSGFNPPGSTPPGNTNYMTFWDTVHVYGPLSGDYLIAGTGANFPSLKAALDSVEQAGVSGPVRFLINTATLTETVGPLQLQGPIMGSSPTNTITIKPNVGFSPQVNITQTNYTAPFAFEIAGVSNVIIDGSNTTGGTTRDMTWTGGTNSSTTQNLYQIYVLPCVSLFDGTPLNTSNVTIKNLNIRGGYNTALTSALADYGVYAITSVSGNAGSTTVSDLTVTNNSLSQVAVGVRLVGQSPDFYDLPLKRIVVTNNLIGPGASGTDSVCSTGVVIQGADSCTVDNNDIQRIYEGTGTANLYGLQIPSSVGAVSNLKFTRNKIHNIRLQGTSGTIYGIFESNNFPPLANNLFANNMVYDLHITNPSYTGGTSSTAPAVAGIFISSGVGDIIANNTVELFDTSVTYTYASAQYTEAFGTSSGAFGLTVVNNIFSNGIRMNPTLGFNVGYMTYYGAGDIKFSDNNIIAAPGNHGFLGYDGSRTKYVGSFDSLKMMTSGDIHSWQANAPFVSLTDPHLLTTVPTRAESGGIPVAGVTVDLDGDTRNATTPDIGADEGNFATAAIDVAINSVSLPASGAKFIAGTGVRPIISVTNFGTTNAYSVPVVSQIIDSSTFAITTVSGVIDSVRAGETRTLQIDSVTYPLLHTYGHRIYVNATADALRTNDSSGVLRITTAAGLSGLYTVGSGQWAPTFKAAFDSLVNYGLAGNVTFQLTDATYNSPAFNTAYIGNGGAILGANSGRRLRIKPASGVNATVHFWGNGSSASVATAYTTAYPGLGLVNTQFLTIDGSNTEGGTTQNLTFIIHPTISSYSPVILMSAAQNDSIKNCVIQDSTFYSGMSGSGWSSYPIGLLLTGPSGGTPSSFNIFKNNWIRDCYYGLYNYGVGSSTVLANGNQFIGNKFSRFSYCAIYNSYYTTNTLFQGNLIQSDTVVPLSTLYPVFLYGQYGQTNFIGNRIWKLRSSYAGAYIYAGIYAYAGGALIANNLVAMEHDTQSSVYIEYPLFFEYTAPYSTYGPSQVYYNTFYVGGNSATYNGYYMNYIYYHGGDIKNNVFVYDRLAPLSSYFMYDYNAVNLVENYNNNLYYIGASSQGTFAYYYNGTTSTTYSNLAAWQAGTGQDLNSWYERQIWQDSVGGNFAPALGVPTRIESHASPIAGITTDINGNTRNARYPDIGAFEGNYTSEFNVDAVATSMSQPTTGTHFYANSSISAVANFRNGGVVAMTNTPITYQVLDGNGIVQATFNTTISSMAVAGSPTAASTFTFTPTTAGQWQIRAFATAPGEEFTVDDTVSVTINVTVGLAGNYNVGVGQYAPTIKAAFDSVARNGVIGAVNFNLTDNTYNEPSITGNQTWSESSSTPITFKPIPGITPVINFSPTALRPWGIRLNSMPSITFDGSNTAGGVTRNTTFQFAAGNTFGQSVFWLVDSVGGAGDNNFVLKNARVISGGTTGTVAGIYAAGSSLGSTGSHNGVIIQNNEIRNAAYGIVISGPTGTPNSGLVITGNQIGPLVGDNTLRIGIEGITISGSTGNTITSNEITGIYSSTGGVAAIDLTGTATGGTIALNKLHDIEAFGATSGSARGIVDNGGGGVTISNNMIWHVISNSSVTTGAGANAGIYLGAASGDRLYFNSIGLTGNRDTTGIGGTGGVSAALYVASTASNLTLVNNIFGNQQTEPSGGRRAYGYVIEAVSSLATASNNNISGTGTSANATNALIAGTSYTRAVQIRTALGGALETSSFTPTPVFISDANLYINTSAPTLIESGGIPVGGITTDIDGNVRNASTPDVGANEGNFLKAVDVIGVSIDQPLNNSAYRPNTATPHVMATFRNGAAGTGTNIPVTAVTYDSLVGSKRLSTTVIIPTLGPGASTQVTFDSLLLPDIGSYSVYAYANYGFDVDNTNDTTASIRVIVCQPLAGTYNIGVGKDFANLSVAAQAAHDCGVQMRVNFILNDASYNEPSPISFSGIVGLSNANIIVVKPAVGVSPVMNIASSPSKNYGILLDSASYVIFDGSNTSNGTTRNWTINLTGANSTASVFLVRDGSSDTIKNTIIRNIAVASGAGITVGPTRIAMSSTMIMNNDIASAASGIVVSSSAFTNSGLGIWNNAITGFSSYGIQIGDKVTNAMIRGNAISSGATAAASTSMTGILVSGGNTGSVEIGANKVMDFSTSATNPVLLGIGLSSTLPGSSNRVFDNMISLGRQTSMPTATIYGIQLNNSTSAVIQNNTVALGGTSTGSGSSYALWGNAPLNVALDNNIFYNGRTNGAGATGSNFASYSPALPTGTFTSDYNDWFTAAGPNAMLAQAQGLNMPTLVAWRMVTTGTAWGMQDRNSVSEQPNFVGTSDLHITLVPSRIQNGGMPGSRGPSGAQDYDIDGNPRGYVPDIGATEFDGPRNNRLAGSYTIDPSTGNYPTLASAIRSLNANGVDAAVDIYMLNGTDTTSTPLTLVPADGIGQNNPVRFHAAAGKNSAIVGTSIPNLLGPTNLTSVLVFDSAANNIVIDGNNGVTAKRSLSIINATGGFANSAIIMTNGASNNAVNNAVIATPSSTRTMDHSGASLGVVSVVSGSYGGGEVNDGLANDSISFGWNGVYSFGAAGAPVSGLTVRQSKIQDFNSSGIFFGNWTSNSTADGNYISNPTYYGADATVRGIRLSSDVNSSGNAAGQNAIINVRSTTTSNVTGVEVTGGYLPFIYNNFIVLSDNTTGSLRGIDEASNATAAPTFARIFFNSINLYGTKSDLSPNDYAIAVLAQDGVGNRDSVMDNIFSLHRIGSYQNTVFALGAQLAADFDAVDFNDYFMPSGNAALLGSVSFPSLATLRAIPSWTGRDANSITGDPKFVSNTDLHLSTYASAVFYKGSFMPTITGDIDYQGRTSIPKPEIGADENAYLGTLPVELLSLNATGLNRRVDVTFRTAEEKNAYGFAVLRSDAPDHAFTEIASAYGTKDLLAGGSASAQGSNYSFVDNTVVNGMTYFYKVVAIDNDGTRETFDRIAEATPMAFEKFSILGDYPNPFSLSENASTKITWSAGAPSTQVEIVVMDLLGHAVRTLVDGPIESAGVFTADWDGKDGSGSMMPSGTYMVTLKALTADGQTSSTTVKIVLTK